MKKDMFFAQIDMKRNGEVISIDVCEVGKTEKETFSSIDEFFNAIAEKGKKSKNLYIYMHDLELQGKTIAAYLTTKKNVTIIENGDKLCNDDIKILASNGSWYKISIMYNGKRIHIVDSKKILPFEISQIKRDLELYGDNIVAMATAIDRVKEYGLTEKITIGSCALERFKETCPVFDSLFPNLDEEVDKFIRRSYMGGWIYTNPEIIGKEVGSGYVYDSNSLYPSVMKKYTYPIKAPRYFKGEDFDKISMFSYFVRFTACLELKKNHFPFIYAPNNCFGIDQGYLTSTDLEIREFVLSKPDFELMFEQYVVDELEIVDGYFFLDRKEIFDKYIDEWYDRKKNAKTKVEKMCSKLYLNSLGGKFGQSPKSFSNIPYINENGEFAIKAVEEKRSTLYVPVAAFMTAYGRQETIRAAQKHFDTFYYSDTDSIHSKTELHDLEIGKELGQWKCENAFEKAKYIKPKVYIEKMTEEDQKECDPHWVVKAAGASEYSKETFINGKTDEEIIDQFKVGLEMKGNFKKKLAHNVVMMEEFSFKLS